jgi:hypothetical protein
MALDQVEFKAPDEKDEEVEFEVQGEEVEVDVVDDTPEEDRGRQPAPPPDEVSDDELETYSESVRKRIKHFTRGYHDERRAKETALREREEALRIAEAVIEENKKLQGSLGQSQAISIDQAKKMAVTDLEQAKAKYKAAYEAGDADAVADAQVALNMATMKVERLSHARPAPLQRPQNEVQPQQIPQQAAVSQPPPVDQKAMEWKSKNPWFGNDEEKTSFALGLHTKLVREGVDPQSDEYYARVNQRLRQVFPELADADSPRAKKSNVAPVSRSTAPKKIVLTQSQVNVAKRLGVPLELYAKQVAMEMRKQNG